MIPRGAMCMPLAMEERIGGQILRARHVNHVHAMPALALVEEAVQFGAAVLGNIACERFVPFACIFRHSVAFMLAHNWTTDPSRQIERKNVEL